jgi:membrane-associated phospholipid phosphatase
VIVAWELSKRRQQTRSERATHNLEELRFTIVYGLLVSYVCYLLLPGVGPRFTLHDFAALPHELPGLWLTDGLRFLINWGENISAAMTNAEAMKVVTRDVFPSGHTEITLLTMLLAFKFKVRARWFILLVGSGLIFSTVYLRYHYVIDVIGGALLAMTVLYSVPWAMRVFGRRAKA